MKLTTARLKKLIREELSRMNEMSYGEGPGYSTYEYEAKQGESAEDAEAAIEEISADYDVVMVSVPMSMKDEYIEVFGDNGRHGPIDNQYYSLTYKN